MWGRETLATEVSSTSMKVASMTDAAISQGLAAGRQTGVAATAWAGTLTGRSSSVPSGQALDQRSREQLLPRGHAAALPARTFAHELPLGVALDVAERGDHGVEGGHAGVRTFEVGDEVVRPGRRRRRLVIVRAPHEARDAGLRG